MQTKSVQVEHNRRADGHVRIVKLHIRDIPWVFNFQEFLIDIFVVHPRKRVGTWGPSRGDDSAQK